MDHQKRSQHRILSWILPALGLSVFTTGSPGIAEVSMQPDQNSSELSISRSGLRSSRQGPDANFTGSVRVDPVFDANGSSKASSAYVTFSPGARSAWHTHPVGQRLVVTEGVGRVQSWGGPREEIRRGDVVWIPPGIKHWHGASPTSSMVHLAVQEHSDGQTVQWMEKVTDEQFGLPSAQLQRPKGPTAAQRNVGNFAPKLAQITDDVLYADVWERSGLSKRDRSLVTVSSLITAGSEEQLRGHLVRAKENGVAESEISEVITHLAFYAGWPKAMTAIRVAREVFGK